MIRLLGISGSLRQDSSNTRLIAAAAELAPHSVEFEVTNIIGNLPLFNPDLDITKNSYLVRWVDQVRSTQGLVICSPEYARGYPGALKNAFDWLVATDAFVDKPFMFLNASARALVSRQTLTTVIETMSGIHVESAMATVPLLGTNNQTPEIVQNATFATVIRSALMTFTAAIEAQDQNLTGADE
ncbi:MAG: NAD(P)H-dependent oxidoreductase [Gammaproteobacteria bacterium]|nr:NAD(P)H-dependent oxidoreductase [Gammaproteobacteria bacterium]